MSQDNSAKSKRPLSPHLQVYKPQMTSVLSIFHRMAGVVLAIGTMMVVWWLVAAAISEEAYDAAMSFARHPLGLFMMFGWSVALFYHMSNGMRHLLWDMGYLFKIENAYKAGYLVLLSTAILTAGTWYCAYTHMQEYAKPAMSDKLVEVIIFEEGIQ